MSEDKGLEPAPAFMARILAGRTIADQGDFDEAEAHFRGLLAEARGGHVGNHASAVSSLVTLYGRAGRYLEVYVLARRLAAMAKIHEPDGRAHVFALGAICGALSHLRVVEPLQQALAALRALLDRLQDPLLNREFEYHSAAGALALHLGDIPRARAHIEAYGRAFEAVPQEQQIYHWARDMHESRLAMMEGDATHAWEVMERINARPETQPFERLHHRVLGVSIQAALGDLEQAHAQADDAIAILEQVEDDAFLASDRIHQGTLLAEALEKLGTKSRAQRVHDLVAAAVMIRLRQVDQCMRDLPELGLDDPESARVLTSFRKQFIKEQHVLLRRVAALLASQGDDHVLSLLHASPHGMVAVCAWCESVRPSEERWLPIGHFIPRDGRLKVTHGICPTCAENWSAA